LFRVAKRLDHVAASNIKIVEVVVKVDGRTKRVLSSIWVYTFRMSVRTKIRVDTTNIFLESARS
jgi:hypothetical protein